MIQRQNPVLLLEIYKEFIHFIQTQCAQKVLLTACQKLAVTMGLILLMKQWSKLSKQAKCCEDTDQPWTKALPGALLTYMHMRKHIRVILSPSEVHFESRLFSEVCLHTAAHRQPLNLSTTAEQVIGLLFRGAPTETLATLDRTIPDPVLSSAHTFGKVTERATWIQASHC